MTAIEDHTVNLIQVCGGNQQAVDAVTDFSRKLWTMAFYEGESVSSKPHSGKTKYYRAFDEGRLNDMLASLDAEVAAAILHRLAERDIYYKRGPLKHCFKLPAFLPFEVVNAVLPGLKPAYEMRYLIMRSIRRHYGALLCSGTAHLFHLLTMAINERHKAEPPKPMDEMHSPRHVWRYKELHELLEEKLAINPVKEIKGAGVKSPAEFFLESCRAVGYILPHYRTDSVTVRANSLDAEYLVSNLFGLSTNIRGFDGLFGGGGLLLAESGEGQTCEALNGRTILIIGRFGTGKTLLALQLAVEVARKGGLAWIMPLEQVAEEYRYILESMNLLTADDAVDIATDTYSALHILERRDEKRGALIILTTIKDSFEDFLSVFKENANRMHRYPLRLICVDPMNSISGKEGKSTTHLREQMVETINEIESSGTNIMLVAEEDRDVQGERKHSNSGLGFEEKVADTVIHLTVKRKYDYAQRYFEITKSRLQREQRGVHAFSIMAGAGVVILPSTAAVRAKMRPRSSRMSKSRVKFGLTSLDNILGTDAILGGDVVVLHGPEGSLKKFLGLIFLMTPDSSPGEPDISAPEQFYAEFQRKPLSLLISARDPEFTYQHIREQEYIKNSVDSQQPPKEMWICELPGGYVNPGYIFQRLDDLFGEARAKGYWIDRVMIDGIAHWEMGCPFIRDDETFADTLVDYLRRRGVTSLLICEEQSPNTLSALQRPIIDCADSVIQFNRYEFRGKQSVLLKVLKSRDMMHRRESFNISLSAKSLDVNPSAALLRVSPGGGIKPVKVSLFLHSETTTQRKIYNQSLLSQVRSVLSPKAEIVAQDRVYIVRESMLGHAATVDELQVYQLDEFQLPYVSDSKTASFPLHVFSNSEWDERLWGDLLPRLKERVRAADGSFFAIPYYENVSMLAYRPEQLRSENVVSSWEGLADECAWWEAQPENAGKIFFDFPKVTVENYTCLFWEILLSLDKPPARMGTCRMREWLRNPNVIKAGKIYRQLCRRAHLAEVHNETNTQERRGEDIEKDLSGVGRPLLPHQYYSLQSSIDVNAEAVVWRHWYSTLNQLMSLIPVDERKDVKVVPLPNDISIAGEWYWGVPSHSAAPEIGLEIIKLLTKHAAELDRLQLGVGLPTRKTFYESIERSESGEVSVSPFFSMNAGALRKLVNNAFRRSEFGCYSHSFSSIAHYLQNIIELPDGSKDDIERGISHNFESFNLSIEFAQAEWQCSKCRLQT